MIPTFGRLLQCTRHRAGISQRALGRALGLAGATISNLEADRKCPSVRMVTRLLWFFYATYDAPTWRRWHRAGARAHGWTEL